LVKRVVLNSELKKRLDKIDPTEEKILIDLLGDIADNSSLSNSKNKLRSAVRESVNKEMGMTNEIR
jgi:hypothetical protein